MQAISNVKISVLDVMRENGFTPNDTQRECILHTNGPLFISAGPGSGKTRVIIWRVVNLIAFHGIAPDEIFLATFTEKAAKQLREGLRSKLSFVSKYTNQIYDISNMKVGTAHSICQSILGDRRFAIGGKRPNLPALIDSLGQYFFFKKKKIWTDLIEAGGYDSEENALGELTSFLSNSNFSSKLKSIDDLITIFNRFSEEDIDTESFKTSDPILKKILKMYDRYIELLSENRNFTDFSNLQKKAYHLLKSNPNSRKVFKHIIVDEYQDTNSIQEKIYFHLASEFNNICVVGDDDQALYRFRGATVENLVQFPERVRSYINVETTKKSLNISYRSKNEIVSTYTKFIELVNWQHETSKNIFYRVHDKNIEANSKDTLNSVFLSSDPDSEEDPYETVAEFCYQLRKNNKVNDYNEIAFLFPSVMNNSKVRSFTEAFENINNKHDLYGTALELKAYAPRANTFLDTDEAIAVWGLFLTVFDRPHFGIQPKGMQLQYRNWMESSKKIIKDLCNLDKNLLEYLNIRKRDVVESRNDFLSFLKMCEVNQINLETEISLEIMNKISETENLSDKCKSEIGRLSKYLNSKYFQESDDTTNKRKYSVQYILNRLTSLDWTILDFFYQCMGFSPFKEWFDLAEQVGDEGPVVNLSQISRYLARYMEEYGTVLSGRLFVNLSENEVREKNLFQLSFFSGFTYGLFRMSETEVEDSENPFPKGRIPFMTIHQSKGLEFPVVVLGSLLKSTKVNTKLEEIVRNGLSKSGGEPLDRIGEYDAMRLFYVALSRPKSMLILNVHEWTRGGEPSRVFEPFKRLIRERNYKTIKSLKIKDLPNLGDEEQNDLGKAYSYTADFLHYLRCPRQYMIVRKYQFAESRSQTMLFGSLVHQTIEDLHYRLKELQG
ncbi:ATP-dependent helicase [Leptospira paudalimensis]|uniref:DNA 3'-5' helicase n=1 Tax=Leptospira paudalimensis TaxID=2950024 RepID=A0ABT3MD14_9LEPT|nr:ATP-dependent helicase [Leptospira paudalimensis]MCW7506119.1 ATP-dependent helicase [Leptospira paudalimensis]